MDVVLNFAPGELMMKSMACLVLFGRFIEIGKMSSEQDAPLSLRPFNENLVFASVDLDRLMQSRADDAQYLRLNVIKLIDAKELGTVPVTLFPGSRVDEAFRLYGPFQHRQRFASPSAIRS